MRFDINIFKNGMPPFTSKLLIQYILQKMCQKSSTLLTKSIAFSSHFEHKTITFFSYFFQRIKFFLRLYIHRQLCKNIFTQLEILSVHMYFSTFNVFFIYFLIIWEIICFSFFKFKKYGKIFLRFGVKSLSLHQLL